MSNFEPFHRVIQERITNPNANYYEIPWWDAEVKQFTLNMEESIRFIEEECTDEEFLFLSEVFWDIVEKTRDKAFYACIQKRAERVANPEWKEDILSAILEVKDYYD